MQKNPFDKKKYPNVWAGHNYATEVISGKIPNSIYIIGACKRYLSDLEETKKDFYFNPDKAERYLRIVQLLPHVIGSWSTPQIKYEPWQCWVWMCIIGFLNKETDYRRFRLAHLEVARGNAKSSMSSQAVLYILALDDPKGNQISTVATRKEQARIVLDAARAMAQKSLNYRKKTGVEVQAHKLIHAKSNSHARALSAEASGLDGLQDILAVMDELHAMRRETFDVVYSGMSKRKDSLTLCITTAGFDIDSVGHSQSIYAKKVALGESGFKDDQFFSAVYTVDDGDDIFSEINWKKANPNYGVSVDPVTFVAKAEKTKVTAADLPNFKVKHLNMWLSEANAFFDTAAWDACADKSLKLEDFKGQKVYMAADLASKIDLASLAYVFKKDDMYYVFDRSYIPEETVRSSRNDLYEDCISKGFLIQTKGAAIYYPTLSSQVKEDQRKFKISDVMVDPWNSLEFSQRLMAEHIETTEFRMNVGNFSEPTKQFDALIRSGKVRHNGSPLLRWCLGNVVCTYDALDNVLPKKSHKALKIDPVVAIIMGLAGLLQDSSKESVYENRGVRII